MIDYHIHTPLCNHARGEMEEYVISAADKGLIEICFLDHLILHGAGRKNSMKPEELPLYFSEAQRLKEKYRGKIDIKVGLEVDYDPERLDMIETLTRSCDFDVIGSSVHFIGDINIASRRAAAKIPKGSENNLIKKYFQRLGEMLDHDYFDFICHFDIIKKTGINIPKEFLPLITKIIRKAAERNIAVELNTGGWQHPAGECYPSPEIIRLCIAENIPVLLSSDAHKPEEVGQHFEKALQILKSQGCQEIASFKKRKIGVTSINLQ